MRITRLIGWLAAVQATCSAAQETIFSPIVSFRQPDAIAATAEKTALTSPVVSFRYLEWPGDQGLAFTTSAAVSYYIDGAPAFTQQPNSLRVTVGKPALFSTAADGSSPLVFEWSRNDQPIAASNSPSLSIATAQLGDAGKYRATVRNAFGAAQSREVTLFVFAPLTTPAPAVPTASAATTTLSTAQSAKPGVTPSGTELLGTLSPSKMTVVLTHGWRAQADDWPAAMAEAIASRYDVNVVRWDWRENANLGLADADLVLSANRTQAEGVMLGQTLMDRLGAAYNKPIHFIGHSLGTLVNRAAADYVHGDKRPRGDLRSPDEVYAWQNTHVTLLDHAEISSAVRYFHFLSLVLLASFSEDAANEGALTLQNGFLRAMPQRYRWADNYMSEVGLFEPGATNVFLWRAAQVNGPVGSHGYSYLWYKQTVEQPEQSSIGHRFSFERNTLTPAAAPEDPASAYLQNSDLNTSELQVSPISVARAEAARLFFPTHALINAVASGGRLVQAKYQQGVEIVGEWVADYVETLTNSSQTAVYFGNANSTPAFFTTTSTGDIAPQAQWNLQFTLRAAPAAQPSPQRSAGGVAASPVPGANSAYVIIPLHVPHEAAGLVLQYQINGGGADEFLSVGLGSNNNLTIESRFTPEQTWNTTPLIPVGTLADQDVSLVVALNGATAAPTGAVSIRNVQFYVPPRPEISLRQSGSNVVVAWPISAEGWKLETSTDLVNWTEQSSPPDDTTSEHTMTFDVANASKYFFRLKK